MSLTVRSCQRTRNSGACGRISSRAWLLLASQVRKCANSNRIYQETLSATISGRLPSHTPGDFPGHVTRLRASTPERLPAGPEPCRIRFCDAVADQKHLLLSLKGLVLLARRMHPCLATTNSICAALGSLAYANSSKIA